jgi:hypothetical protein
MPEEKKDQEQLEHIAFKDKFQTGVLTKRDAKGVFKNSVKKLMKRKGSSKNLPHLNEETGGG